MATGVFAEKEWILLPLTPSFQFNNLSNDKKDKYCYCHLSEVIIVNKDRLTVHVPIPKAELYQASFITIAGTEYLAVASNLGIQLWLNDGSAMLFSYSIDDSSFENSFLRGIAGGLRECWFAVGSSDGEIIVFDTPPSITPGSSKVVVHSKLSTERSPIITLVASPKLLIACNENGDIFGFNCENLIFQKIFQFNGGGVPCTSLILRDEVLVSSYSNGCIKVYRLGILEMSAELAIHGGSINALSIHSELDIFASCSDFDQTVCIFSFPTFINRPACYVELLSSNKLENKLLTGLAFISHDTLAVSCYDNLELGILKNLK